MEEMFRLKGPSAKDLEAFHQDGYIAYPDVLTDVARESLIDEVVSDGAVRQFLDEPDDLENPGTYFVRPWDNRGPWSDRLIDAPFITALLRATIATEYHFCHSAMNVSRRGVGIGAIHQDHHHWKHAHPINFAERDKYYIQVLYYPNGFKQGDRSLRVIPGSHLVAPTEAATPERMLAGEFDAEVGRRLALKDLEMPPGSMIYINARIFHGVAPKPADSPQAYRIFLIDIFKEAGPPHRYTQEISPEWMAKAGPERLKLFQREPYTDTCWD
jgi:hypothetical protein